jgi:hypothetical protein
MLNREELEEFRNPDLPTLFISGHIGDYDNPDVSEKCFKKFEITEELLLCAGYGVVNPLKANPEPATRGEAIRNDLKVLLDCDGVCLTCIGGEENNLGKSGRWLEYQVAKFSEIKIDDLAGWLAEAGMSDTGHIRALLSDGMNYLSA